METIKELSTPIVAILNLIGYWYLYTYQKNKISFLENKMGSYEGFLKTQSDFIEKEIARNKQILDIDDFHKKLEFKLSLQQDEFEIEFKERANDIFNFANEKYAEANQQYLSALGELLSHAVGVAKLNLNENYAVKPLRDTFFREHFPKSAKIVIYALDAMQDGQPNQKNNP